MSLGPHGPFPLAQAKQVVPVEDVLSLKMGPYFPTQTWKPWFQRGTHFFRGTPTL